MKCVLTVLGKDRSGIVAGIASALATCGVNIDDISQTILDGIFTMTMMVTVSEAVATFNEVQEKVEAVATELGDQAILQRQDVFDAMFII